MPLASAPKTGMSASQPQGARRAAAPAAPRDLGEGYRYAVHALVPLAFARSRRGPPLRGGAPAPALDEERRLDRPAELLLVFLTSATPSGEPCALKLSCSGEPKPRCVRTRISEGRVGVGAGGGERGVDRREVVAVVDADRLPAVGLEALGAVLGERDVGAGGQRHVVVVVQADQLAELAGGRPATPPREATPSIRSPSLAITQVRWSTTRWPGRL